MASVYIVYAAKTKTPRRWIIPDSPHEVGDHLLAPGEAGLLIDHDDPHGLAWHHIRDRIAQHHGIDPEAILNRRCHVIHSASRRHVATIHADPEIDVIPDHHLVHE